VKHLFPALRNGRRPGDHAIRIYQRIWRPSNESITETVRWDVRVRGSVSNDQAGQANNGAVDLRRQNWRTIGFINDDRKRVCCA